MYGILIVAVIAIVAGLLLSWASIQFAVPVDEKQAAVREALPGANCGACGFSGCDGYAAALAAGTAEIGLCSPGGPDVAEECATILGKAAGEMVRKVALVQCNGTCTNAGQKLIYDGVDTWSGSQPDVWPATAHVHMAVLAMVTVQLFALRRQSLFTMVLQ